MNVNSTSYLKSLIFHHRPSNSWDDQALCQQKLNLSESLLLIIIERY